MMALERVRRNGSEKYAGCEPRNPLSVLASRKASSVASRSRLAALCDKHALSASELVVGGPLSSRSWSASELDRGEDPSVVRCHTI